MAMLNNQMVFDCICIFLYLFIDDGQIPQINGGF